MLTTNMVPFTATSKEGLKHAVVTGVERVCASHRDVSSARVAEIRTIIERGKITEWIIELEFYTGGGEVAETTPDANVTD